MQHPFGKIIAAEERRSNDEAPQVGQSRRQHLKRVLQLGVGAFAAGVAGTAHGFAGNFYLRRAAPSLAIPQGARRIAPHPEAGGTASLPMQTKQIQEAARLLQEKNWSKAAPQMDQLRRAGPHQGLKSVYDRLDKSLKDQVTEALDKADEQAKAGELVPSLEVFRLASRLNPHYGMQERTKNAIAEMEKHELYPVALAKVKKLEAEKAKPKPNPRPTLKVREGGGNFPYRPHITTKAIGEEGGRRHIPDIPQVTTQAIGEEG